MTVLRRTIAASAAVFLLGAAPARAYDVTGRTIASLDADLAAGRITSADLVKAYEQRIARLDRGPGGLHAVIALNPDAFREAAASDARRAHGKTLGPLDGIPILMKDNIETADPLPTTAGSLALIANVTRHDAPAIARLRAAGAVILGKTNLSEWANFRSSFSISGWSGVGGLTHNPYALDRSACGSSSGSAAAVAASFAAAAIGTETDGSVTCPAAMNGLAGIKPTLGLVSRSRVVPISPAQDTPGPLAHDVADAALLLHAMAGTDPLDAATAGADAHIPAAAIPAGAPLHGARIGVLRYLAGHNEATDAVFARALAALRAQGATLIDITDGPDMDALGRDEGTALSAECKSALDAYLAATPQAVHVRSLAQLIAFDSRTPRELALFGQDALVKAEATHGGSDPAVQRARQAAAARAGAIATTIANGRYDALVAPTETPAFLIDTVDGDHDQGSAAELPAVAGLPHLTVPMGTVQGLPVGISFIGPRWGEDRILALGAAFEHAIPPIRPPTLHRSVAPTAAPLLEPATAVP